MPIDYGTDYDISGKLTDKGDLKTVSYIDNVKQSIKRQVETLQGVYSYISPFYGNIALKLFGLEDNIQNRRYVGMLFEQTATRDPRVYEAVCDYDIPTKKYTLRCKIITDSDINQEILIEGQL